jgi:ATP sulfurylase
MVIPRGGREAEDIHAPEYVKSSVRIVFIPDRENLSSTLIRELLVNGESVPPEMMSPAAVRYINEHSYLYRKRSFLLKKFTCRRIL